MLVPTESPLGFRIGCITAKCPVKMGATSLILKKQNERIMA
ncbi:MAG: hypothetical protein ACFFDN_01705 [Candidatus Hodarchaeota archaeon]